MKPANTLLSGIGTTIFTVMSALAVEHGSINLGQGFPDTDGPADVVQAAADALKDGRNQYPPMPGVPELRQAVAAANRRFYGLEVDWASEVVVTSGATEAITACLMAVLEPGRRGGADRAALRHLRPGGAPAGRRAALRPAGSRRTGSCRAPNWPPRSGRRPRRSC